MAKSTLSEIHLQVVNLMYNFLNEEDSTIWKDSRQVFYSPVDSWEDSSKLFSRKYSTDTVKYPYATVTRGDYEIIHDISVRGWSAPFVKAMQSPTETESDKLDALPVSIAYTVSIYDNTFDDLELITEHLMFMRGKETCHEFTSNIVNEQTFCMITHDQFPSYSMIPDKSEKETGRGSIYKLSVPLVVRGLVLRKGTVKRILTAKSTIHHNDQDIDSVILNVDNN